MMTRDSSLYQIAACASPESLSRHAGITAGEVLDRSIASGLDAKDRAFFARHASEPAAEVARACHAGRVWPGDDSHSAQRLRYPHQRTR